MLQKALTTTATAYCRNREIFKGIVRSLFRTQWFSKPVDLTGDMLESFYQGSKGLIDQIIRIYYCMHIRYFDQMEQLEDFYRRKKNNERIRQVITSKPSDEACGILNDLLQEGEIPVPKGLRCEFVPVGADVLAVPIVDAEFVEETKKDYMSEMIRLLNELDKGGKVPVTFARKYQKLSEKIDTSLKAGTTKGQTDIKQTLLDCYEAEDTFDRTRKLLVENLRECMPQYNMNKIMEAADHAIRTAGTPDVPEVELITSAIKWLNKKKSDRRTKDLLPVMK